MQAVEWIPECNVTRNVEEQEVEHFGHINNLITTRLQEVDELVGVLHDDRFLGSEIGGGEYVGNVASADCQSREPLYKEGIGKPQSSMLIIIKLK